MSLKNEFYKGFENHTPEKIPANYHLLSIYKASSEIITSGEENYGGITVGIYATEILSSEKHHSPISKIIDLE